MTFSNPPKSRCLVSFSFSLSSIRKPSPLPVYKNLASWEAMIVLFLTSKKPKANPRSLPTRAVPVHKSAISRSSWLKLRLLSTFLVIHMQSWLSEPTSPVVVVLLSLICELMGDCDRRISLDFSLSCALKALCPISVLSK
jgi:hypothetical protein